MTHEEIVHEVMLVSFGLNQEFDIISSDEVTKSVSWRNCKQTEFSMMSAQDSFNLYSHKISFFIENYFLMMKVSIWKNWNDLGQNIDFRLRLEFMLQEDWNGLGFVIITTIYLNWWWGYTLVEWVRLQ